jgi:hypothetical protein
MHAITKAGELLEIFLTLSEVKIDSNRYFCGFIKYLDGLAIDRGMHELSSSQLLLYRLADDTNTELSSSSSISDTRLLRQQQQQQQTTRSDENNNNNDDNDDDDDDDDDDKKRRGYAIHAVTKSESDDSSSSSSDDSDDSDDSNTGGSSSSDDESDEDDNNKVDDTSNNDNNNNDVPKRHRPVLPPLDLANYDFSEAHSSVCRELDSRRGSFDDTAALSFDNTNSYESLESPRLDSPFVRAQIALSLSSKSLRLTDATSSLSGSAASSPRAFAYTAHDPSGALSPIAGASSPRQLSRSRRGGSSGAVISF